MTQPAEARRTKRAMAAVVVLAAALVAFVVWQQRSSPKANFHPSDALGEVLASEVSRLATGATVAVIARASAKDARTSGGRQISSFEAAVRRQAGLQLAATEWLPPEAAGMMAGGGVTAEQLSGLVEKHPDANVFVIFAGLPPLSPALAGKLKARSVTSIAVCGYGPNARSWLEARALATAVIPRLTELPAGTPAPRTPTDWFQREFELVTPENVGRLPY